MARAYSLDLRERVVAAVIDGRSCRQVAGLFRVSVASVVKWVAAGAIDGQPRGPADGRPCGRSASWTASGSGCWIGWRRSRI